MGRPCCRTGRSSKCVQQVLYCFVKHFFKGFGIKCILVLAGSRSVSKVLAEITTNIPRFGLAIALMSGLFHLVMCGLHKLKVRFQKLHWLQKPHAHALAAVVGSLPLSFLMSTGEQNIMKLFFFPLACRCFVDQMVQRGILPRIERHGDILGYLVCASVIGLMIVSEKFSNSPSMHRMVHLYMRWTPGESRSFGVLDLYNRSTMNLG